MADAPSLILKLHGHLLRSVCENTNMHFSGLAAAARHLRKHQLISSGMQRKLAQLDTAAAWVRHITTPLADSFTSDVLCCLKGSIHVPTVIQQKEQEVEREETFRVPAITPQERVIQEEELNEQTEPIKMEPLTDQQQPQHYEADAQGADSPDGEKEKAIDQAAQVLLSKYDGVKAVIAHDGITHLAQLSGHATSHIKGHLRNMLIKLVPDFTALDSTTALVDTQVESIWAHFLARDMGAKEMDLCDEEDEQRTQKWKVKPP